MTDFGGLGFGDDFLMLIQISTLSQNSSASLVMSAEQQCLADLTTWRLLQ
jgi:hypothetical protein